jgi:CheY-like chemotaxis protein
VGNPDIIGNEPSPLSTAMARKTTCTATMLVDERYYQLNVAPVIDDKGKATHLIVTLRDSTDFTLERKKFEALHEAGMALADLRPAEIFEMEIENRIDLLKENILHYTQHLLNFNFVELRLIDQETGRLEPLLSVGINSERSKQPLYAKAQDNGVTGFVAATGKSYLCEDTTNDPLYLDGLVGAKSSLTVPLIYHDQVIGSFNVEHPDVGAFNESDLKFVEAFARDIAQSLNTLELLVAQKTNAAQQSVEAIHCAVALPVDEILNDTVQVIENYIGHNPDVVKRLRSILKNARDIKQVIQKVGEKMAPADALPASIQVEQRPALKGKNVLVIDADEQVRTSAHNLLERYGCTVETAHEGSEAILMIRNAEQDYDAILSDIRLPDISGYDLLVRLKELTGNDEPNLILMTGFGYDPGHSIVKARQAGLRAGAVLYKPFRLDQLLAIVESMVVPENSKTEKAKTN